MEYFDPVLYSIEELNFLIANLGKPTVVALSTIRAVPLAEPARRKDGRIADKNPVNYPDGVNPAAVKPILDKVNEFIDLEKHQGAYWCGVEALKEAAQTFLTENEKWKRDARRGAPRWPSMFSYDMNGRGHLSGPGSDSGQVRTYFGADGKRKPFRVPFVPQDLAGGNPEWANRAIEETPARETASGRKVGLRNDTENHRIECLVCGHTEQYKTESRSSYNAARARMSRHLRSAKTEADAHAEVHVLEYK